MSNIRKRAAQKAQGLPKRHYDSSRRRARARETRLEIAEAARQMFFERGYAGATIEAIAERAGVATETVYAIFQNKRNILAFLLDISVGGDDQAVRLIDRAEPQAVLKDTDARRQLAGFAAGVTEILARAAPVFEIMRGAAKTEPEIARRVKKLSQERLENMRLLIRHVVANGPLRGELDETRAAETVWALASPELFRLIMEDLAWSTERYRRWLADNLIRLLLP